MSNPEPRVCREIPPAIKIGDSSVIKDPEPMEGYSVWIESGTYYAAPTVDADKFGGHAYDGEGYEQGVRDCPCGAWMCSSSSGGPVDPVGPCPLNPLSPPEAEIATGECLHCHGELPLGACLVDRRIAALEPPADSPGMRAAGIVNAWRAEYRVSIDLEVGVNAWTALVSAIAAAIIDSETGKQK